MIGHSAQQRTRPNRSTGSLNENVFNPAPRAARRRRRALNPRCSRVSDTYIYPLRMSEAQGQLDHSPHLQMCLHRRAHTQHPLMIRFCTRIHPNAQTHNATSPPPHQASIYPIATALTSAGSQVTPQQQPNASPRSAPGSTGCDLTARGGHRGRRGTCACTIRAFNAPTCPILPVTHGETYAAPSLPLTYTTPHSSGSTNPTPRRQARRRPCRPRPPRGRCLPSSSRRARPPRRPCSRYVSTYMRGWACLKHPTDPGCDCDADPPPHALT